jgi:hypothetical protein
VPICDITAAICTPRQSLGFALEGHPLPGYNGAYRKVSEHKGWPVLRNGAGMFCYRYEPTDDWHLNDKHAPDSDACFSYIKSAEGPLPIGAQTWQYDDGVDWVDRSLSVTVLVRPFSFPDALCASLHFVRLCHIVLSCHPTMPTAMVVQTS